MNHSGGADVSAGNRLILWFWPNREIRRNVTDCQRLSSKAVSPAPESEFCGAPLSRPCRYEAFICSIPAVLTRREAPAHPLLPRPHSSST